MGLGSSGDPGRGWGAEAWCCLPHDLGYKPPNTLKSFQDLGRAIHPCAQPPRGSNLAGRKTGKIHTMNRFMCYNERAFLIQLQISNFSGKMEGPGHRGPYGSAWLVLSSGWLFR